MPQREYKVSGTQPTYGHQPGEKFTADIPEDQEKFLVGIGALKVVEREQRSPEPRADRR